MLTVARAIGMAKKDQSSRANVFSLSKQKGSRFYSMRLMYQGKRRRFSTGMTNLKDAQAKAKAIMADIQSRGFDEAVFLHSKRRNHVPLNPTIEEFSDLYREVSIEFDRPPSNPSRERYIRSLERITETTKVKRVEDLNEAKIALYKNHYLKQAKRDGRDDASSRTTLNGILRNAASLFSTQALHGYSRRGLKLGNPFTGLQIRGIQLKQYSPLPREILDTIWKEAPKLRDGDSKASGPDETLRPRDQIDFREPHGDAYGLLLLELGLGLRRNEADKAEWDWFFVDPAGRRFIEVRETPYFMPKSRQNRIIPVDEALWKALEETKTNDKFVVDGLEPVVRNPEKELKSAVYRCDQAHRTLVAWLRMRGVNDPKPCHRLRKEFGSYVSTTFGLFHAQRFLGHSSPNVTSDYYAGLTELPQVSAMPASKSPKKKKKKGKKSKNE